MAHNDLGIEDWLRRKVGRPTRSQSIAICFADEEAKRIADEIAGAGGISPCN